MLGGGLPFPEVPRIRLKTVSINGARTFPQSFERVTFLSVFANWPRPRRELLFKNILYGIYLIVSVTWQFSVGLSLDRDLAEAESVKTLMPTYTSQKILS